MRRALDLFCGAGGVAMGLRRAGFHVTGIDIKKQPRYAGNAFICADSTSYDVRGFDLVWASPPCQFYSMYSRNMGTAKNHPDLISHMRMRLLEAGGATVIENVAGAPLRKDLMLCGSMFGLAVVRHRFFEMNFKTRQPPPCRHTGRAIPVFGHGTPQWHRKKFGRNITIAEKRAAMDIDWMNRDELNEAIPPAYSEFIGAECR